LPQGRLLVDLSCELDLRQCVASVETIVHSHDDYDDNEYVACVVVVVVVVGFIAVCSVALVVIVVQFPRDVFVGQTQQTSETKF
jgi:hypothetical protein